MNGTLGRWGFSSLAAMLIGVFSAVSGTLSAQDPPAPGDEPVVEFVDQFNARFATQPPLIGSQILSGLTAFDAAGQPFEFASLKGQYTVIVFGCLT